MTSSQCVRLWKQPPLDNIEVTLKQHFQALYSLTASLGCPFKYLLFFNSTINSSRYFIMQVHFAEHFVGLARKETMMGSGERYRSCVARIINIELDPKYLTWEGSYSIGTLILHTEALVSPDPCKSTEGQGIHSNAVEWDVVEWLQGSSSASSSLIKCSYAWIVVWIHIYRICAWIWMNIQLNKWSLLTDNLALEYLYRGVKHKAYGQDVTPRNSLSGPHENWSQHCPFSSTTSTEALGRGDRRRPQKERSAIGSAADQEWFKKQMLPSCWESPVIMLSSVSLQANRWSVKWHLSRNGAIEM